MRSQSTRVRIRLASALVAALALMALPSPAGAVINPVFDGNQHPNVGIMRSFDATGEVFISACTGALVDPQTVLTAGHCTAPFPGFPPPTRFIVSFDPTQTQLPGGEIELTRFVEGTADPNPLFDNSIPQGTSGFVAAAPFDMGLIHLKQPAKTVFPGIKPAPIAAPNAFASVTNQELLTQVGYAVQRLAGAPPGQADSYFLDGTRNQSSWPLRKLTAELFFGNANPSNAIGYGAPCGGDSGSPIFAGAKILGVYTLGGVVCNNITIGARTDTGAGRAFLRSRGLVP